MKVGEMANPFALVFGTDRSVQEKASPITHIHKGLPPFLVLYATSEVPGLAQQAVDFGRHLAKVGTEVEVRQIPEATHRTILFHLNNPSDPTGKALLDFVHKTTAVETGRSRASRN
jgi:acetyl esterase/lipase